MRPARGRGFALVLLAGVLSILSIIAALFLLVARMHRGVTGDAVRQARAALLSRSGIARVLSEASRLAEGSPYGGEDHDGDGRLDAGTPEEDGQVYRPLQLDDLTCPLEHALRPSYFASRGGVLPELIVADDRLRGYSGRLRSASRDGLAAGGWLVRGDTYVLRMDDESSKINVNGGYLDDLGRDPDPFPDYSDPDVVLPTGEGAGWNRSLKRILDTLGGAKEDVDGDGVLDAGEDWDADGVLDPAPVGIAALGELVLRNRPEGGYTSIRQVQERIGFPDVDLSAYLTVSSWVDRKVVRPNAWRQTAHIPNFSERKKARLELVPEETGRPPVNLNAAHPAVLFALLQGIRANSEHVRGGILAIPFSVASTFDVSAGQASTITCALVAARRRSPLRTWQEFGDLLDDPRNPNSAPSAVAGFPVTASDGASLPCGQLGPCDMIKANFDPNTRVQEQLPDDVLARWFDKSDLLDDSTEGTFHPTGTFRVSSLGRVTDGEGVAWAVRQIDMQVEVFTLLRHTTQADFLAGRMPDGTATSCLSLAQDMPRADRTAGAQAAWNTWGMGTGLAAMTYPCPMQACAAGRAADFDGYVGLSTMEIPHDSPEAWGGTLTFLDHFDDGWDADVSSPRAIAAGVGGRRLSAPPGTSPGPIFGVDCDRDIERTGAESVWPRSGGEPGTLYPDGMHGQDLRSPAYSALNLPEDVTPSASLGLGGSDHGVIAFWQKRARPHSDTVHGYPFSCVRYSAQIPTPSVPVPTQLLGIGSADVYGWWGAIVESNPSAAADDDPNTDVTAMTEGWHRLTRLPPRPFDLRWRLAKACFDTDEDASRVPPPDIHASLRGVFTASAEEDYFYPRLDPLTREKLVADPSMRFVLGPQVTCLAPSIKINQILDEVAIADFGDDGAVAVAQGELWMAALYTDGRYYKWNTGTPGDARFLSSDIVREADPRGGPVRLLRAWWTEWLPQAPRKDVEVTTRKVRGRGEGEEDVVTITATYGARWIDPLLLGTDAAGRPRIRIDIDLVDLDGNPVLDPATGLPLPPLSQGGRIGCERRTVRYRVTFRTLLEDPLNQPLLETPFLDDVTLAWQQVSGPRVTGWIER